jgi:hypothetical protein
MSLTFLTLKLPVLFIPDPEDESKREHRDFIYCKENSRASKAVTIGKASISN